MLRGSMHALTQTHGDLDPMLHARWFLTEDVTKLLVHSLMLSRLNYCPAVCMGSAGQNPDAETSEDSDLCSTNNIRC